jgi:hypothetical protein
MDKVAEIRKLYFSATRATIAQDFDRAIDLLKSIPDAADRESATVFMAGLAEMRNEWKGTKNVELRTKNAERRTHNKTKKKTAS